MIKFKGLLVNLRRLFASESQKHVYLAQINLCGGLYDNDGNLQVTLSKGF